MTTPHVPVTTWVLDRRTTEWVGPIVVSADDAPVAGWKVLVLPYWDQSTDETAIDADPTDLGGKLGVMVGPGTDYPLTRGTYKVLARYTSNPESPVLTVAVIVVT